MMFLKVGHYFESGEADSDKQKTLYASVWKLWAY